MVTLVAAGVLAGCGLGAGATPTAVRLDITRAFGSQIVRSLRNPQMHGQETAMSLLLRNATVSTRYGGGFVESIDGRSGGYEGGQPVDWFYYVNGVLAPKGAAETNVRSGDRIWWDLRDWSQAEEVPAVVGSFPEPFANGIEGRRLSVRVECAAGEQAPCRTVVARLRAVGVAPSGVTLEHAAGVTSGLAPPGHTGETHETVRVLVGTWSALRTDPGAKLLEHGPGASGVYARVLRGGGAIALLDAQGQVTRTLTASAGLIAATRYAGEDPEWLVTGTDAAGLALAAQSLTESTLHDRFAVALSAERSGSAAVALALPQPSP
jgi:hypothetical protein